MALELVLERFLRIAGEQPSGAKQLDFDWADLIGPKDLLKRQLIATVRGAAECDPTEALRQIWSLTGRPTCLAKLRRDLAIAYALGPGLEAPWAERLHRNVCLLIAAAGVAACQVQAQAGSVQAWFLQIEWWKAAAERFGFTVGAVQPKSPPDWPKSLKGACAAFQNAGWDSSLLGCWSRWWAGESLSVQKDYEIPLAGCCAGTGFLADLVLVSVDPNQHFTIEHPEGALQTYGESLTATITDAARGSRKGVAWRIRLRAELPKGTLPLDGNSLGAAAAVGFRLLNGNLPYDHRGILICTVLRDGRLGKVGGESAKLEAAKAGGFGRAGVAADSELTGDDIRRMLPLQVKHLRTVAEAEQFARNPPPYL
jgi:hypothetical protein